MRRRAVGPVYDESDGSDDEESWKKMKAVKAAMTKLPERIRGSPGVQRSVGVVATAGGRVARAAGLDERNQPGLNVQYSSEAEAESNVVGIIIDTDVNGIKNLIDTNQFYTAREQIAALLVEMPEDNRDPPVRVAEVTEGTLTVSFVMGNRRVRNGKFHIDSGHLKWTHKYDLESSPTGRGNRGVLRQLQLSRHVDPSSLNMDDVSFGRGTKDITLAALGDEFQTEVRQGARWVPQSSDQTITFKFADILEANLFCVALQRSWYLNNKDQINELGTTYGKAKREVIQKIIEHNYNLDDVGREFIAEQAAAGTPRR